MQHARTREFWYSIFCFQSNDIHPSQDEEHSVYNEEAAAVNHRWAGGRGRRGRGKNWPAQNFPTSAAQVCESLSLCLSLSLSLSLKGVGRYFADPFKT